MRKFQYIVSGFVTFCNILGDSGSWPVQLAPFYFQVEISLVQLLPVEFRMQTKPPYSFHGPGQWEAHTTLGSRPLP